MVCCYSIPNWLGQCKCVCRWWRRVNFKRMYSVRCFLMFPFVFFWFETPQKVPQSWLLSELFENTALPLLFVAAPPWHCNTQRGGLAEILDIRLRCITNSADCVVVRRLQWFTASARVLIKKGLLWVSPAGSAALLQNVLAPFTNSGFTEAVSF